MNRAVIAVATIIGLSCIIMLIWAWRSGDGALVAMMAVALALICGVGSLPFFFNRTKKPSDDQIRRQILEEIKKQENEKR